MDCLFCKIINKEIPSEIIYEDEDVMAFLDINPTTNGNTLIVPKKHYQDIFDIDDDILNKIYQVGRKLYPTYQEKLNCEGLTLCHNSQYGQEIKHFHLHFIPRYKTDKIRHYADKDSHLDIKDIAKKLKS